MAENSWPEYQYPILVRERDGVVIEDREECVQTETAPEDGFLVESHHSGLGCVNGNFFTNRDKAWSYFLSRSSEYKPHVGSSADRGQDRWSLDIVVDLPEPEQWARFYPVKKGDVLRRPD